MVMCENHKVYYCLRTGGLRCRKCKILLNDFGNEYKPKSNMTQIAFTSKELVKFLKWFCDSDFYETEIGGQFKNIKQSDVIYTFQDIISHYYSDPLNKP